MPFSFNCLINRSIITSSLTFNKAFGPISFNGIIRKPKPAARITADWTLYGFNMFLSNKLDCLISETILLTFPREKPVNVDSCL